MIGKHFKVARALFPGVLVGMLATMSQHPGTVAAAHMVPVTVTITRVVNIGGTGIEDPLRGDADLYAGVEIDGTIFSSFAVHVDNDNNIEPFWVFTNNVVGELPAVSVSIEVWDHDECSTPFCTSVGIFESVDDKGDVDPGGDDEVNLTVNLADGTWTGDTTGSCSQGTGSSAVLVCWDISVLSTNGDADGDGLLDGWETNGFDGDGDGVIDVDLPTFGADPMHKDLFLEFDWIPGEEPTAAAIATLKAAFAAAPINAGTNATALSGGANAVANPDGLPGINLWVDTGNLSDAAGLVGDNLGGGNALPDITISNLNLIFYVVKTTNFDAANRRWIFRYAISGDPADDPTSGGWGEIGGNDFIDFNHDAGTIMHELGHTVNLQHGGFEGRNCKPSYVSVMNYDLQFGIPQAGGGSIIDYSPPRFAAGRGVAPLPTLVENNLNEATILDPTDATNRFVFVNGTGQKIQNPLNQQPDWNGDGDTADSGLTGNIDTSGLGGNPGACTNGASNSTLVGHDDWTRISIPFRQFGDASNGAINPVTQPEPTVQELLELQEELNTTDLAITKSDSADPAVAGEELTYTLTVTNNGPNPASDVEVVDTLPAGVSYVSDSAGCTGGASGTLTCELGELLAGETRVVTVTVLIDADLVYNAGGPTTVTNTASVDNQAGPDPDASNNNASEDTLVVAVADLEIVSFEAVDPPEDILVDQPVEITLRKVITNNGPSAPMDVVLDKTATAPPDASVSPTASSVTETALGLGEMRVVEEVFTIECDGFSEHTFVFTNEVSPLNAEDTDPNPDNNTATVELVIECVVPVQINIKPASDPNSINLRSDATVAVLTTDAGEYGLPLAFDATLIDPLSVRFGTQDEVWAETGGAFEKHGRGHVEDSFELDETTQDGDEDMVLHFEVSASGVQKGDTLACVKGEWVDGDGIVHTFFGCDVIKTVGKAP